MKKVISILLVVVMSFVLFGCASKDEQLEAEILRLEQKKSEINTQIYALEDELSELKQVITDIKVDAGVAKYIITLNIRQTHFTFDLETHLKDSMNEITIQIPVDKEYFDSLNVGDIIDDSFRMGSLIFKGSWGSWKITVQDKYIA